MDTRRTVKVLLAGDGMVGKTALARRFGTNMFSGEYQVNILDAFTVPWKTLPRDGSAAQTEVDVVIYDTAGRQPASYFSGVIIVSSHTGQEQYLELVRASIVGFKPDVVLICFALWGPRSVLNARVVRPISRNYAHRFNHGLVLAKRDAANLC
jgi:GTPase SAR1 family protein